jgi:energy-coupling factor transporter ATP-binding protein EcfA2
MKLGPVAKRQLARIDASWSQGEHILVTGPTGSGKTELARLLDEMRIRRGGYVVTFVCKLQADETITKSYAGWTRWKTWKRRPGVHENRILLWPDVEGKTAPEAIAIMKIVFKDAIDAISKTGKWTVHIDEGLIFSNPAYIGLANELGLMYALMRSAKTTMITLAQRPSHLPLSIYANLSKAFIGRASEASDLKRLADMDGYESSRELQRTIMNNGLHDFTYIDIAGRSPSEQLNLAR